MPDRDVDGVQTRHRVVEPEEQLRDAGIRLTPEEMGAGQQMLGVILVILEGFHAHEENA